MNVNKKKRKENDNKVGVKQSKETKGKNLFFLQVRVSMNCYYI